MNSTSTQNISVRHRSPPINRAELYGKYAPLMSRGEKPHKDTADRAAYVFVTGCFPSHLRPMSTRILTQITRPCRHYSSFDARHGHRILPDEAIRDLNLNAHEMVKEVRGKVHQGYIIQPSRGSNTRRGFSKIYMFKRRPNQMSYDKITITLEGAVKVGWN